jgi:NADPH:quinone reductase-like Zn-dependent oxidoreductase
MKAIRFHEYGDPGVLRYEDADRPEPAEGEVLVEVAAASFNPVDAKIRAGYLQQVFSLTLPHIPGIDMAGTVAAVGAGVTGWTVGDQVIGFPVDGLGRGRRRVRDRARPDPRARAHDDPARARRRAARGVPDRVASTPRWTGVSGC